MENQPENNKNLDDKNLERSADRSNMPEQQVPRHRSNKNENKNEGRTESGNVAKDFWGGDFGSEEAKSDPEKGNKGHAGNMPNTAKK